MPIEGIQPVIFRGRAVVGQVLGQSYNVYRLNNSSTGSLYQSSNLVLTNFRCRMKKWNGSKDIETNYILKVPVFEGACDASQLKIGDLLIENGKYNDGGAFTYAYFRPLRTFLFVQTPLPCTWTRSASNPAQITSGRVPYQGMQKDKEQVLVLTNGSYNFTAPGTPATVYCGLVAFHRSGELPRPDLRLPTDVKRQEWHIYAPLLPGVTIFESDLLNAANGDRYYARTPFVQYVGFQGWSVIAEKLRV